MSQNSPIKPAPYSPTDTKETESVDIFKVLVDHSKVKLDIKERDKIPNIDGYMELVDDGGSPCGKLEAQIKKIPDDSTKLQIPTSLFSYSDKATCNPVILIGVNTKNKQAFWFHINSKILKTPIEKLTQATITIDFSPANIIDGISTVYLSQWQNIVDSYIELKAINEKYELLQARSNSIVGIEKEEFTEIQKFLDEFNSLLDGKFSIIKKTLYPNSWKTGFAYNSYTDKSVSFSLYSIPFGRNDVLIKEIDDKLEDEMRKIGYTSYGYLRENPVRIRPKKLARDQIQKRINEILQEKLLKHASSEFLVREFIFAFIDKFHIQMGLEKKDYYELLDIEKGFYEFLPFWTIEAINFLVETRRNGVISPAHALFGRSFFDPSLILASIMPRERETLAEKTKEDISKKTPLPYLPIGNKDLSFKLFYESLASLRIRGTNEVKRPYLPKDFSRFDHMASWVWNSLSPEALQKNLSIFFECLPEAYSQIVRSNFEEISKELPLFGNANLFVILLDVKPEVKTFADAPTVDFFAFYNPDSEFVIKIINKKEATPPFSDLSFSQFHKEVKIDDKSLLMVAAFSSILDFIFEDTPMLNFVYKQVKGNLDSYFNKL